VNRQAQAVVMLLFGGAVLRAGLTDLHLRYVKEGLRPFLIAAGVLLVATGVMTLWYDLRRRPSAGHDDDGHGHHDDGHGHHDDGPGHHGPRVGWLLVLPVLGLLLVAPPALGAFSAGQAGSVLAGAPQDSDFPALPAGDPARITVLDYASRAVFDDGRSLGDRKVQLTGFVTAGPDGRPMLARIILSCCAADGRPIKVGLSGDMPAVAPDTWVELVGTYSPQTTKDPINDATVPYLTVTSWREVPAPRAQYE
jgi:uncharacterized repeat protein (TIGR03943 family)